MARLGDVATYINGYAFKPADWSTEGVLIIRIQDLTGNSYKANRFKGKIDKRYEVLNGDVLISWSASLGVYVWSGEKAVLNQHIFKVQFDKTQVDKSFFVHQVECILKRAIGEAHGATMKHLTKPAFDALPFYLPDIQKQKAIADSLDKISHLITLRKRQLSKLDELVKSRFVEMFGDLVTNNKNWSFAPLGNVCDVRDGTHASPKYHATGYPLMTSKNFTNGYEDFSDVKLISKEDFVEINKRSRVDLGDIVMPMIGTIGCPVIIKSNREFAIKNVSLIKFTSESPINIFVKAVLSSHYFKRIIQKTNRGNTQKFIALGDIRDFPFPLPPLTLQREFAAFVENVDKLAFKAKASLEKLETLKKAMMQKYFN